MQDKGPTAPPPPGAPPPPPPAPLFIPNKQPTFSKEVQEEIDEVKAQGKILADAAKAAAIAYKESGLDEDKKKQEKAKNASKIAKKAYDDFKSGYVKAFRDAERRNITPLENEIKEIEEQLEEYKKEVAAETKALEVRFVQLEVNLNQNNALFQLFSEANKADAGDTKKSDISSFLAEIEEENFKLKTSQETINLEAEIENINKIYNEKIANLTDRQNAAKAALKVEAEKIKPLKAKADAIPKLIEEGGGSDERRLSTALEGYVKKWFEDGGMLNQGLLLRNLRNFISENADDDKKFLVSTPALSRRYIETLNWAGVDLQILANIAVGYFKRPAGTRCQGVVGQKTFMHPIEINKDLSPAADLFVNILRQNSGQASRPLGVGRISPTLAHANALFDNIDVKPIETTGKAPMSTAPKADDKGKGKEKEKWGVDALNEERAKREQKIKEDDRKLQIKVGGKYGERGTHKDAFSKAAAGLKSLNESFLFLEESLDETRAILEALGTRYHQPDEDEDIDSRIAKTIKGAHQAVVEERRKAALLASESEKRGLEKGILLGAATAKTPAEVLKTGGLKEALKVWKSQNPTAKFPPDNNIIKNWASPGPARSALIRQFNTLDKLAREIEAESNTAPTSADKRSRPGGSSRRGN